MNMKYVLMLTLLSSMSAYAEVPPPIDSSLEGSPQWSDSIVETSPPVQPATPGGGAAVVSAGNGNSAGAVAQNLPGQQGGQQQNQTSVALYCKPILDAASAPVPAGQQPPAPSQDLENCKQFKWWAQQSGNGSFMPMNPPKATVTMDGAVRCTQSEPFHYDYTACGKAVALYNAVMVAEVAMEEQQKIRTDLKNKSIQRKANEDAAKGDLQSGMFDAAGASNDHAKNMEIEKAVAYGAAIGALMRANHIIPDEEDLLKKCAGAGPEAQKCGEFVKNNKETLLANQGAKDALKAGIARFSAKAAAAGLKAWMYGQAVDDIEKAKGSIIADEEAPDLMVDRCQFNPTDPACAKSSGQRVKGASLTSGQFGVDGMGNNAFDLTPGSDATFEEGAPTDLTTSDPIAGINSPFVEDAKDAKDILNPAAAASFQPTGGAGSGGGGGVGGGGGGGGASLGSDLAGADKDGDKEAQIKTGKVSGAYAQGGGGGYKGIGKSGKDDANPFASLFDAKSNGGVEEDRSIASGDIDGKASGLFQKISKRYGQIQADKRVEAKNLE